MSKLSRASVVTLFAGMLILVAEGCVAPVGGYGYTDVGAGYYQPYYAYYNNWGPNYLVAPYHYDHPHFARDFHGDPHAYRSGLAPHGMPSIPSQVRGASRAGYAPHAGSGHGEQRH